MNDHITEALLQIIMCNWETYDYDRPRCQFCGTHQGRPTHEYHWEHCPRLVWATAKKLPKTRVAYQHRPSLIDEGPRLLAVLAEYDPDTYGPHKAAYDQQKQERTQ